MKKRLEKGELFAMLSGVFCACLIISNILAFKTFTVLGLTLPAAVIIFPVVYIANDVLAEVYGFEKAKRIILLGFGINLLAVIVYNIAIALPAPDFFTGNDAFSTVLSNSLRILIASFSAYLIGSLINSKLMVVLKEKYKEQLMFRCVASTFVGEGVDAMLFITIAFAFTMPFTSLILMIITQAIFKTVYEIIVYPVTKRVIAKVKEIEGVE